MFDHELIHDCLHVFTEDEEEIVFGVVITSHRKPDSGADNPDDYYGYTEGHLEVWEKTDGFTDKELSAAFEYAESVVNYEEVAEELLNEPQF